MPGTATSSMIEKNHPKTAVIIGCGISGASAADELIKAGYRVVLLEKNHRVGGKLKSEKSLATDNTVPELGGVVLTSNYPTIDTIIKHKMPTDVVFEKSLGVNEVVYDDSVPTSYWDSIKFGLNFIFEYSKFAMSVWTNNNATAQQGAAASGYTQMFSEFAEKNGLHKINNFLKLWIPGMGYGLNNSNYTFRILNYMGYATIPTLVAGSYIDHHLMNVSDGYQSVVEKMLADKDVRLRVEIQSIIRNQNEKVIVTYNNKDTHDGHTILEADLLVLTISPELWPMLNMILTPTEESCVADVKYIPYPTAVCDIKNFPKQNVFVPEALNVGGLGHVGFITTKDQRDDPLPDGRRCTIFMNIDSDAKDFTLEPDSLGRGIMLADLKKLGYHDVDIKATKVWKNYNTRLSWDVGMQLEREQGQHQTLYVGTYSPKSFETAAAAEGYTRATVQTFCNTVPSVIERASAHVRRAFQFFYTLPNHAEEAAAPEQRLKRD